MGMNRKLFTIVYKTNGIVSVYVDVRRGSVSTGFCLSGRDL